MIGVAELPRAAPAWPFLRFLRDELTLSPGRWQRMVRITALVSITVIVSNALRVPEVAISAFVIFFAAGTDFATTLRIGIGGIVGLTLAIALSLCLFVLTAADPLMRVSVMTCTIFFFFYLMKASALGPLAFLIGFVAAYALTLFDRVPSPEALIRGMLWLWVALVYPIAMLLISEIVFGQKPAQLFRDAIAERLTACAAFLSAAGNDSAARERVERFAREGSTEISRYAVAGPASGAAARAAIVRQMDLLLLLLRELPSTLKDVPQAPRALGQAADECLAARGALLDEKFAPLQRAGDTLRGDASVILQSVRELRSIVVVARHAVTKASADAHPAHLPATSPSAEKKTEALRFAVKVTLAALIAYLLYTGLHWSGIHTAVLTVFFVAQDTVGATIHKFTLRIAGALVGGTLGILSIVFVLPQLETAGGLVVLVAIVTLFGAWFATGSQAISYAGVQIVFAFYLAVLQGFSRTSKMVVARDRVIGILLGILIVYVVFTRLWPVRIKPTVRQALSRAVEALAATLRFATGEGRRAKLREAETAFHTGLSGALQLASSRRLEPGDDDRWSLIPEIESLFVRIHGMVHERLDPRALPQAAREALSTVSESGARWLSDLAASIAAPRAIPAYLPATAAIETLQRFASSPDAALLRGRVQSLETLDKQIAELARAGEMVQ